MQIQRDIFFNFLVTKGNLTLVFHKGVNSIRANKLSAPVPTGCLLFLVTNGNLTLLFFHVGKKSFARDVCYF